MNSLTFVPITFGLVSVVFLAVAMGTDYWLFTVEPIRRQNITSAYGEIIETETSEKFQHLGLWRVCTYHDQGNLGIFFQNEHILVSLDESNEFHKTSSAEGTQ